MLYYFYNNAIITHFNKRCNSLDDNLKKYYEDRFSTFATEGWNDFVVDVTTMLDVYNRIDTADSFEEFHKRKGQIDILQWILSLKDVSEQTYDDLVLEEHEKTL